MNFVCFYRFSSIVAPVLAGRIPSKAYDCFLVCCEVAQMLYSKYLWNFGWSQQHVARLDQLMWTHAIKAEEFYRPSICTENLEYSVHMSADVLRHSAPDNYSCDMFERVIRKIKEQKHNSKGLEKIYCERESIRLFFIDYQRIHGSLYEFIPEKYTYRSEIGQPLDRAVYLNERSFEATAKLLRDLGKKTTNNTATLKFLIDNGVFLGSLKRRSLLDSQCLDIQQYVNRMSDIQVTIPTFARFCSAIVKYDSNGNPMKFAKGDFCVIAGGANLQENWNLEIQEFILIGPSSGRYYVFVSGNYYIPTIDPASRKIQYHPWTGTPQVIKRDYNRGKVQLASQLRRLQILYLEPSSLNDPSYYLTIDFDRPPSIEPIDVSVYPVVNDCVAVQGTAKTTWYGKVITVDYDNKSVRLIWFNEIRPGILKFTGQFDNVYFRSILRVISLKKTNQGFQMIKDN